MFCSGSAKFMISKIYINKSKPSQKNFRKLIKAYRASGWAHLIELKAAAFRRS